MANNAQINIGLNTQGAVQQSDKLVAALEAKFKGLSEKTKKLFDQSDNVKKAAGATNDPVQQAVLKQTATRLKKEGDMHVRTMTDAHMKVMKAREKMEGNFIERIQGRMLARQALRTASGQPQGGTLAKLLFGQAGAQGGMLHGANVAGGQVGQSALMMGAAKMGGAPGAMVAGHMLNSGVGLAAGTGLAGLGLLGWGISKTLGAGAERTHEARGVAPSLASIDERGVRRMSNYNEALKFGMGEGSGLLRPEANAMAATVGRAGINPAAMKALGAMQTRFGMGDQAVGVMGALEKFGGSPSDSKQSMRMMKETVASGMASGLKLGRLPEFFNAITSLIHTVGAGMKANINGISNLLVGLGRAGFKGEQGQQIAQGLDALSKGQGGSLSNAMALQAAGFGNGATYGQALRTKELGLFGSKPGEAQADVMNRFKTMMEGYEKLLPNEEVRAQVLSAQTGGKIGINQFDMIIKSLKEGTFDEASLKKMQDDMKTPVEKAFNELKDIRTSLDTMAEKIATAMAKVFNTPEFLNALKTITDNLPKIATGIGELVRITSKGFNVATELAPTALSPTKSVGLIKKGMKLWANAGELSERDVLEEAYKQASIESPEKAKQIGKALDSMKTGNVNNEYVMFAKLIETLNKLHVGQQQAVRIIVTNKSSSLDVKPQAYGGSGGATP